MTLKEVEAQALKLSPAERVLLAQRLLAVEAEEAGPLLTDDDDPIHNLGKYPASGGDEDPIDGLGRNPVTTGVTDGSVAHDRYLYGSPPA